MSRLSMAHRLRAAVRSPASLTWPDDLALPLSVGVVQLAAAALSSWHHYPAGGLSPVDWVLLGAGPVALVARRRHPVGVLSVALAVTLGPSGSSAAYLSLVVAFFLAATQGHRKAAWASIAVGFVWSACLGPLVYGTKIDSAMSALVLGAWLVVLGMAAEGVRMTRQRRSDAHAARQIEARRQASDERLRMARELHDVIGHNISLINFQAGVGLDLWDQQPEQAHAALTAIKAVSKEALGELRAMLGAFRQDEEEAPRSPVPGLGRLGELVELTKAAGLAVTADVGGSPQALPAGVDLAAYRIVQESLTNVARHAPSAQATVRVVYGRHEVVVEILNDAPSPGHDAPARGRGRDDAVVAGTGSGIAGMRERAVALGGDLAAGPQPGGGFAVIAHLPVKAST